MAKTRAKTRQASRLTRGRILRRLVLGLLILGSIIALGQPAVTEQIIGRLQTRLEPEEQKNHGGITNGQADLSQVFTPEVLFWEDNLIRWGAERSVNPNLLATIMQIESCGHPYVSSVAGAQGLFQVMPLHFDNGENQINPETNAQNGIDHLIDCLVWSDYDVGVSLGCYNAGPSVIGLPFDRWFNETQNYYRWGTGIFQEAIAGENSSNTLQQWLAAGGSRLCQDARYTQDVIMPDVSSGVSEP